MYRLNTTSRNTASFVEVLGVEMQKKGRGYSCTASYREPVCRAKWANWQRDRGFRAMPAAGQHTRCRICRSRVTGTGGTELEAMAAAGSMISSPGERGRQHAIRCDAADGPEGVSLLLTSFCMVGSGRGGAAGIRRERGVVVLFGVKRC